MKIAVMGEGVFGGVLGKILADNGHEVSFFDPIKNQNSLEEVLFNANLILTVVPSDVISELLQKLPNNLPLINATKGILNGKIFDRFDDWMVISGPGFAKDIEAHKKTLLTTTDERVVNLFETDYLKFELTSDKLGVLMCGALKNVYAIEAGYLGLIPGTSEMQTFLQNVKNEMKLILAENGANPQTVELACGIGDLKLTCSSDSRNYEFGMKVREDEDYRPDKTTEGITTLSAIRDHQIKLPFSGTKILNELIIKGNNWV